MGDEFVAYAVGLCAASVCSSLTLEETSERLNREHPTMISSDWTPSSDKTFRQGQPNPCPCEDKPETHRHWLFEC